MISYPLYRDAQRSAPSVLCHPPPPFKAVRVKIQFMHRFMVAVGRFRSRTRRWTPWCQLSPPSTDASRGWRHGSTRGPGQIRSHEQQFLARECPHPAIVGAQVANFCHASPGIRSRIDFLPWTLHHATTAGRSFQCSCRASRGQFIVMILTINRVELHVVQGSCIQPRFHLYQKPRPPMSCDEKRQGNR